jgi:glycosyltransferase involved in cell wall biosynthesis
VRVLLLVDCYLPSRKAQAKLIHDLGAEFRRQGDEVVVLTSDDAIPRLFELSYEDGLTVARVRTGQMKGARHLVRAMREETLSLRMWIAARQFLIARPCDLIVFYSPTIFFGALVRRLKQLWSCPAYLVLRDIFPKWAVDAGVLRPGLAYRFLRRRELQSYAAADIIGVQSPGNLDYFHHELTNHRYRLDVLHNWASLDEGNLPELRFREKLGLQDKVIFFYGGNIGVAQDMDNIVRLAAAMQMHEDAFFLLAGDGSEVERLRTMIQTKRLRNVRIEPALDQREYLSLLSEVDVGIVSLERGLKTQNFPGKMLGYMYSALPMLASLNSGNDLGELIDRCQVGLWSINGEDDRLLGHARTMLRDVDLRKRLGANSRRLLAAEFSAKAAVDQIRRSASNVASASDGRSHLRESRSKGRVP